MDKEAEDNRLTTYRRRVLVAGLVVLAISFAVGIFLSFYQWDRGSPFAHSSWGKFNPLGRATYGPLAFVVVLFPITVPVLVLLLLPVYFGMKSRKLWPLAILGFSSIATFWVFFVVGLWEMD